MAVYSLVVEGVKNCNKNFATLQVGVPIVERIGWKVVVHCKFAQEFYLTRIKCLVYNLLVLYFCKKIINDFLIFVIASTLRGFFSSKIDCGYNRIRNRYGDMVRLTLQIEGFENFDYKLWKCHLDLRFLLDCKKNGCYSKVSPFYISEWTH